MIVWALSTSVGTWQSPKFDALDRLFIEKEIDRIPISWENMEISSDGMHFTRKGYKHFVYELSIALSLKCEEARVERVFIFSDSTLAHVESMDENVSVSLLKRKLFDLGITSVIDAVSGSGFISMSDSGYNFRPRIAKVAGEFRPEKDAILLIGGWNDIWGAFDTKQISLAMDGVMRCVRKLHCLDT